MDLDDLMDKDSDYYRFHGVRRATLERLVSQAEGGELLLYGRTDEEGYARGAGELSVTCWKDVEMSCNEFCDDGGLVLVLEPRVDAPAEEEHPTDRREHLIRAEEWQIIGAIRPILDEDEEIVDFEALSVQVALGKIKETP